MDEEIVISSSEDQQEFVQAFGPTDEQLARARAEMEQRRLLLLNNKVPAVWANTFSVLEIDNVNMVRMTFSEVMSQGVDPEPRAAVMIPIPMMMAIRDTITMFLAQCELRNVKPASEQKQ